MLVLTLLASVSMVVAATTVAVAHSVAAQNSVPATAMPTSATPATTVAEPVAAAPLPPPGWTTTQAMQLVNWLDLAPRDGLPAMTDEATALRETVASGDVAVISRLANVAGARLLERHRNGSGHTGQRRNWGITGDQFGNAGDAVAAALALNQLDALFTAAIPSHPHYVLLREALADETDAQRQETLRLNMDRWRWMPRDLGRRYLLVNVPSYEVTLWQDGQRIDRWRTIVGRPQTRTVVFSATVSGVVLNPWWEIPTSIAAEGISAMVRNRPAEAARRGYVLQGGRYRQRPGPGNSLGRMKLVMPNNHAIFLHDTPAQALFANPARAYSHGCVRVNAAVDFASAVLSTRPGWTRANTDAILASGRTQTVDLPEPIPIYIAYFTTAPFTTSIDSPGEIRHFPDIYTMDRAR